MSRKLIIDRLTWYRGQGSKKSRLFNPETGKKCCLGFACEQLCGLKESEIANISSPIFDNPNLWLNDNDAMKKEMEARIQKVRDHLGWLLKGKDETLINSGEAISLMMANDLMEDNALREPLIIILFAEHDVEVEFIN